MFHTLMRAISSGRFSLEGAVLKFSSMSCAPVGEWKRVKAAHRLLQMNGRTPQAPAQGLVYRPVCCKERRHTALTAADVAYFGGQIIRESASDVR